MHSPVSLSGIIPDDIHIVVAQIPEPKRTVQPDRRGVGAVHFQLDLYVLFAGIGQGHLTEQSPDPLATVPGQHTHMVQMKPPAVKRHPAGAGDRTVIRNSNQHLPTHLQTGFDDPGGIATVHTTKPCLFPQRQNPVAIVGTVIPDPYVP